jgi:hypothetical protein
VSDLAPLTPELWEQGSYAELAPYCKAKPDPATGLLVLTAKATRQVFDELAKREKEAARMQRRIAGEPEPESTRALLRRMRSELARIGLVTR